MDNQQGCMVYHRELYLMYVTAWMGEEFGDGYMYVCGRVLSLSTETIILLLMSYTPIENKKV